MDGTSIASTEWDWSSVAKVSTTAATRPFERDGEERSHVIRGTVDVAAQARRNRPGRGVHTGEVAGVVDRRRPRQRIGDDQVVGPLPDMELAGVGQVVEAVAGVVVPQEDVDVPARTSWR